MKQILQGGIDKKGDGFRNRYFDKDIIDLDIIDCSWYREDTEEGYCNIDG